MMNLLLIIHIFITLALIGVILLQRAESGGLGLGGGGNSASLFTARGSANLLTRATAVLATIFIGNCLLMTIIASHQTHRENSLIEGPAAPIASQH
ncbi:MAG: preprotein translocase subunit SecG [Alphaproteobacteria bacterium]